MAAAKRKPGRPKGAVVWQPAHFVEEIVDWLVGGDPLEEYSRQPGKPCTRTIYRWAAKDAQFASDITRAREWGTHALAAKALHIANTPMAGEIVTEEKDPDGKVTRRVVREDMLGHRRLQVETILKLIAKWNSGKYGDKQHLEHGGSVSVTVVTGVPEAKPTP